jgi:hypothetical protein
MHASFLLLQHARSRLIYYQTSLCYYTELEVYLSLLLIYGHMAEVVESWRVEKLKDIKVASTRNQSNLDLSSEETSM